MLTELPGAQHLNTAQLVRLARSDWLAGREALAYMGPLAAPSYSLRTAGRL
jgi:hypothetical protein